MCRILALFLLFCSSVLAEENPAISCTQKLVTEPKFAPIAKKLPLGDMRDINFEQLANKAIPTQKEAKLIAEWVEARKSCFNIGLEYGEKNYPPQVGALAIEANNQVTAVIADLFNKKFSYGAANKQIQTIADDYRNKLTAVAEQIKNEQSAQQERDSQIAEQRQAQADAARQQKAQADEQREAQAYAQRQQEAQADDQRRQQAMQIYLMNNKPFVPYKTELYQMPVSPRVTSNCSQIGNQWTCVTQ